MVQTFAAVLKVALCSCDKLAGMRPIDLFAAPRGGDTKEAHACKFSRAPGPGVRRYDARKNVHIGRVDNCSRPVRQPLHPSRSTAQRLILRPTASHRGGLVTWFYVTFRPPIQGQ